MAKKNLPSTKGQFTQENIPEMLQTVNDQIKRIKGDLPQATKTTGELEGFGRINQITTVENLIKAHSMIVAKQQAFNASCDDILPDGVKKPSFKIDGSAPSSWIADIKGRIGVVAHKAQLEKLTKIKEKLEANLSAEAKLAKDLADIQNILEDE